MQTQYEPDRQGDETKHPDRTQVRRWDGLQQQTSKSKRETTSETSLHEEHQTAPIQNADVPQRTLRLL